MFINGKGDCGPVAFCAEQMKGAMVIFGIVAAILCTCICCCCCVYCWTRNSNEGVKETNEVEFDNIQGQPQPESVIIVMDGVPGYGQTFGPP